MRRFPRALPLPGTGMGRLAWCGLSLALGAGLALLLLVFAGEPARPASAAAPAAPSASLFFPGCGPTIQSCLNVASPGGTVVISAGTYITHLTLSTAVNLTGVNSATVILQALPNQRVLTVTGAAVNSSVVISGLTFTGGSALGGSCPAGCGGGVLITGTALPRLQNLILAGNSAGDQGGGLYASGSLTLTNVQIFSNTSGSFGGGALVLGATTLNGGLFQNNQCTQPGCGGGGLYANSALALTSTQFVSNTAGSNGGAAAAFGATTLNGGVFRNNHCTQAICFGGGLYVNGTLAVSGTQFLSNKSRDIGGGALALGATVLNGGLFQNNQCDSCDGGGGLYAATSLALTATQFISNAAEHQGGGAHADGAASLNGGLFQDNRCTGSSCHGGGLYASATLALTGTQFLSNTAIGTGGGATVLGALTLNGGRFQNNQCTTVGCTGGGIYAGDTLVLTGTQFVSNAAGLVGGGAYIFDSAELTGGLFQSNRCTDVDCTGGGLSTNTLALTGTQFLSNTALGSGGGVIAQNPVMLVGGLFQNNQCTQAGCSGGGLYAGNGLTLIGTQFLSNSATSLGGGALSAHLARVTNGLFQNNQCTQVGCIGGGLYVSTTLALSGTQFLGNSAFKGGGGALAFGAATVNGGLFQNNRCTQVDCDGGGLWTITSLALTGTQFLSNTATLNGGGASAFNLATLSGGLFQNNHCTQANCQGGGLSADTLALSGTQFLSNTAVRAGGGVLAGDSASVVGGLFQTNQCTAANCLGGGLMAGANLAVTGTRFLRNSAQGNGGGLAHANDTSRLVNDLFAGNTAGGAGAALYIQFSFSNTVLHTTFVGAAAGGSGIALLGSAVGITNSIIASYTVGISVTAGTARESHNLFFANGNNFLGTVTVDGSSQTGDPRFVRPAIDDDHLRRTSLARGLGVAAGVTFDIDGDVRPQSGAFDAGYDQFVNVAPVAAGEAYAVNEGSPLVVPAAQGVLANDTDANLDGLTALLVTGPATGTLNLASNGGFSYTPAPGFTGVVTFSYRAFDGDAVSNQATVTLTVAANKVYLPVVRKP